MKCRSVLVCCLSALCLACPLSAAEPSAPDERPEVVPPSDDAAVWYLTSWIRLDQIFQTYEDPGKTMDMIRNRGDEPVAIEKLGAVTDNLQEGLDWARDGAVLQRCTWPVDIEQDGPLALLPHLGMMRRLANCLEASARVAIARGELDQAERDWLTIYRMSKHAGADGTLIATLVAYSIEGMAIRNLAEQLDHFDRAQLMALRDKLEALPSRTPISEALSTERMLVWWLKDYSKEHGVKAALNYTQNVDGGVQPEGKAPRHQQPTITDEQFEAWFEQADALYLEAIELMALPYQEFVKAYDQLEQETKASVNPLMTMVPSLSAARRTQLRSAILRAMLDAMIAYRLGGAEAFNKVTDPYDGKPFDREVTDEGVVLSSRLIHNDKRWSLTFSPECAEPLE